MFLRLCMEMVFCSTARPNSKTFLVVYQDFWVFQAFERLTTRKFDLWDPVGVKKVKFPRLSASKRPGKPRNRGQTNQKSRAGGLVVKQDILLHFWCTFNTGYHQLAAIVYWVSDSPLTQSSRVRSPAPAMKFFQNFIQNFLLIERTLGNARLKKSLST